MAEPNSGGTGGPGQPKKELSMELRLLLAFILMGVVLFVTPYFYKTVAPPVKKTDRKSTRLNSSHLGISYAVFCLKKKTQTKINHSPSPPYSPPTTSRPDQRPT